MTVTDKGLNTTLMELKALVEVSAMSEGCSAGHPCTDCPFWIDVNDLSLKTESEHYEPNHACLVNLTSRVAKRLLNTGFGGAKIWEDRTN